MSIEDKIVIPETSKTILIDSIPENFKNPSPMHNIP